MKKFIISALALFGIIGMANAQELELPKYQRSSLHTVLLTTVEETVEGAGDFTAQLDDAWQSYPFPAKYNDHKISFTVADGGSPKGGLMATINHFSKTGLEGLSLTDAKSLLDQLKSGKAYQEDLVNRINEINNKEKIGNQLIRKWYNIQDDGSYDMNLINERAAYNANQAAIAEQELTQRGVQAILDQGEDLIANTFVTFSKLSMYNNEPIAAFIRDLTLYIGCLTPAPANIAVLKGAELLYNETKDGKTAQTTTALYQLVWDDEVINAFYSMFENGKINMEKFNAYTFPMTLVGIDSQTTVTLFTGQRSEDVVIKENIIRNIDKMFIKLQKNYEVFAPVSQIISVDPLVADMGTKEGLKGGEKFELLEPVFNKETNKFEWKSVGVVKVDKKQIWNNEYSLTDDGAIAEDTSEIKGTVLSKNKKAVPGMVVRQVVKKKK